MKKILCLVMIGVVFILQGCDKEEPVIEYTLSEVKDGFVNIDSVTIRHKITNNLTLDVYNEYTLYVDGNKIKEVVGDDHVYAEVYDDVTYLYSKGNFSYIKEVYPDRLYLSAADYMPNFDPLSYTEGDEQYTYVVEQEEKVYSYVIKVNDSGKLIYFAETIVTFADNTKTEIIGNTTESYMYAKHNNTSVDIPEYE